MCAAANCIHNFSTIRSSYIIVILILYFTTIPIDSSSFTAFRPLSRQRESIPPSIFRKQDVHLLKDLKIEEENEVDIEDREG